MRLSVHCQSPELQQPARAGKVGASGPQAQRHGTDFTDRFPKIAADAVENLRVRSCVLDDGCSGRKLDQWMIRRIGFRRRQQGLAHFGRGLVAFALLASLCRCLGFALRRYILA
jgi:hypothetical protein